MSDITVRCMGTLDEVGRELAASLADWDAIIQADPLASIFQGPGWCMNWYRAYSAVYDPFVIAVRDDDRLVGVVPMAVEKRSGELIFASGNMADYRDVAALPGYRDTVLRELVGVYRRQRFAGPLRIGWIDPASDTPANIGRVCAEQSLNYHVQPHACWRWFPAEGENLNKKFSRVKTHLNYFKRQGEVTFEVITQQQDWLRFRDEFFQQHSLRQLQAGRPTSFDNERKQSFYDGIFSDPLLHTHVTALRVNGRLLAGHVGLVWRRVLMLGAPSISIEDENRSPALLLFSWIIQNASDLGLDGFDLTIGDSEFKRRLGNRHFELQTISIYTRRRDFAAIRARTRFMGAMKAAVSKVGGPDAWEDGVKEFARKAGESVAFLRNGEVDAALAPVWESREVLLLEVTPDQFRPQELPPDTELHENRIPDLLLPAEGGFAATRAVGRLARTCARLRGAGNSIYTAVSGGSRLVAWICSASPEAAFSIAEVPGATLECQPGTGVLSNLWSGSPAHTAGLIASMTQKHFDAGAQRVYLIVPARRQLLRKAAGTLGFSTSRSWKYRTFLGKVPTPAAPEVPGQE